MSLSSHHLHPPEQYDLERSRSKAIVQARRVWDAAPSEIKAGAILEPGQPDSETSLVQQLSHASLAGPLGSHELLSHISSGPGREGCSGKTAILSNGGGAFAVQLAEYLGRSTVVSPDVNFIQLAKEMPLGSGSAVQRYLNSTPTRPFGTVPYVLRSGLTYRTGSLDRTSLPSSTFSFVVIEQGQFGDLRSTLAEACRIARSGGTILLVSYANMRVIAKSRPPKDEILVSHINGLLQSHMISFLNPFLTFDEQLFRDDFRTTGYPLSDANDSLPHYRKRMIMRSVWNLSELVDYMASWPVVRRLETSGSLQRLVLWNFRAALKRHWGSTKTRRVINWPVHSSMDSGYAADLLRSAEAKSLVALRQSELETFMLGVGLFAAQTTSCVVRLSPGVNHVFTNLTAYANNVRSPKLEARLKSRRLFDRIQENLVEAVGAERIAFIEKEGGPLKIVCDAPIEWLPIGNLPLGIRHDCSRLNATPGNLLMGLLTEPITLTFTPKQLQKILVVSSFRDDDPLRNVLVNSLEAIRNQWEGKTEIVYKTARSSAEFIEALNGFDGNILIFDGHGAGNADTPVGKIMIADEAIDVWSLRGSVRTPPIVILSACDTHGIDASSQATVGNAFLGIGARTVLATLLPVGGHASAAFVARLVYRIADFIPAVLSAKKRVLNWTEIISGLLRMLLASEILNALVGPPAAEGTPRARLQAIANIEINSREFDDWYERLLGAIAEHRGEEFETVRSKARNVLARSEAIRYVQLGNPETILIDDGEIRKQVLQEYNAAVS